MLHVPETVRVLGLPLRPFSLGHVILLHRIESSFVTGGAPTFEDLAASVMVCAQTYREAIQSFTDPDLDKFMRRWHERLTRTRWLRRRRPLDFVGNCKAFAEYIQAGSKIPDYAFDADDMREVNCPSVQQVKIALMSDMGFSEAELLDRSWGLCLSDYIASKAMKGQITIYRDGQIAEAKEAALAIAARMAKGGSDNGTA